MDSEWVEPALALQPESVLLAPFEQHAPRWWIVNVLTFPSSPDSTPQRIYSSLRAGLSRTLVQVPLLAGRLENTAEADGKLLIRVPEQHAGVKLSRQEYANGPTYAQLKAQYFSTSSLAAFGADILPLPEIIHGAGVFLARANFIEGGVLLALGISHGVADGEGFAAIQRIWARNIREVASGIDLSLLTLLPFETSRARLFHKNDSGVISKTSPYIIADKIPGQGLNLEKLPAFESTSYVQPPFTSKTGTRAIWYFSPDKLRELKQLASTDNPEQWTSTFDALTAFLWHRTAIARRLSTSGFTDAKCFVSMNVRQRLQPPLHPDFVGNASDLAFTQCPSTELEESGSTLEALPKLARQIRSAIQGWTTKGFDSLIGIVGSLPLDKMLSMDSLPGDSPGLLVTDTSKSQTYSIDWGNQLGYADTCRFLLLDPGVTLFIFLILPQLPNGGLELLTFLGYDVMEKLKGDAIFTRFAEFRGA